MTQLTTRIVNKILTPYRAVKNSYKQKVFCIGKNKTGTTSMAKLFTELGLVVGSQYRAERLTDDWLSDDYTRIIRYVRYGGEAFQDIPFSLPKTYKVLDKAFPQSRFILTERKSAELWCDSLIKFHSKVFGRGSIPTAHDLQNATYVYKGFAWKMMNALHDIDPTNVYDRSMLIRDYEEYNEGVKEYFKGREEQLLVVTLEDKSITTKISAFLNTKVKVDAMPWENKTRDRIVDE